MNQPSIAVQSYFRGRLIDMQVLDPRPGAQPARRRRPRHRRGAGGGDSYRIGSGRRVDAPVGESFVGAPEHALVTVDERGAALHVTARMVGMVRVPGGAQSLATLLPGGAGDLALAADSHAEIRCGAMTFQIGATDGAAIETLPPPRARWHQQRYTLAVAVATLVGLGVLGLVPPDPKALSLDLIEVSHRMGPILIRPPEIVSEPVRDPGATGATGAVAPTGASASDPGAAGTKTAPRRPTPPRLTVKGSTSDRYHLRADPNPVSVLSLLSTTHSSTVQSIFTRGEALPDAESVLGALVAGPQLMAYGAGGLGLRGTGSRDAGTGEGLRGGGPLGRLPGLGRYGDQAGQLSWGSDGSLRPGKKIIPPEVVPGIISTRGSLDKELVRRTIRAHLNEVRYCYEQELPRHPNLAGRIAVQFVITPNGRVASSVVQESTLHLGSLESCVTQAVSRWAFPQPSGGGLTIVTYPFVLARAGA